MNNIWIFGDSFVSPANKNYEDNFYPEWTWTKVLANKLDLDIKMVALPGISNQWLSYEIIRFYDQIEQGDTVVIVTTEPNRNWLLYDKPSLSQLHMLNAEKLIGKKKYKVIQNYYDEFSEQHELVNKLYYEWFLQWCRSKLSNRVKLCLLPGFNNTHFHDTTDNSIALKDVDEKEFQMLKDKPKVDNRINHLSTNNHKILADKVYRFLEYNEKIDLTTEFWSA